MIREFFTGNYAMFYEWVGLLVMLGVSVHISPKMKRQTRIVVALLFAETLFFYLERWTQTFETLHVLRPLLTAAVYSIYPVIMLLVMQITSTGRFSGKRWWTCVAIAKSTFGALFRHPFLKGDFFLC